jgi:GR25 family glycosyltransferase involved in LPS biosynthesis
MFNTYNWYNYMRHYIIILYKKKVKRYNTINIIITTNIMTSQVSNCLVLNLDSRTDLWNNLEDFRKKWLNQNKKVERISGVDYKNDTHVLNKLLISNRINLSGTGFRNKKESLIGELGCFMGHYNCWKYIIDNKLDNCLILEDGIEFLRSDFENLSINNKLDILFVNEEMQQHQDAKTKGKSLIGYGLQGYVVTQKGASKLIEKCYTLVVPIDLQIRHLCNTNELNYSVINKPFFKRNHNRASSIEGIQLNDQNNLNEKQNQDSLIQRIIKNIINKNINLDDLI